MPETNCRYKLVPGNLSDTSTPSTGRGIGQGDGGVGDNGVQMVTGGEINTWKVYKTVTYIVHCELSLLGNSVQNLLCVKIHSVYCVPGVFIFHFVGKTIPGKISFFWQDIIFSAGLVKLLWFVVVRK